MQGEFKQIKINKIQAPNLVLTPLELKEYIDFEVKRIYFISKPTGPTSRHSHLNEKELFVMAAGSCTAIVDKGEGLVEIRMHAPEDALYIGNYVWHGFKDFSPDAVLIAISSTNYNPSREDYIEDQEQFKEALKNLKHLKTL